MPSQLASPYFDAVTPDGAVVVVTVVDCGAVVVAAGCVVCCGTEAPVCPISEDAVPLFVR